MGFHPAPNLGPQSWRTSSKPPYPPTWDWTPLQQEEELPLQPRPPARCPLLPAATGGSPPGVSAVEGGGQQLARWAAGAVPPPAPG